MCLGRCTLVCTLVMLLVAPSFAVQSLHTFADVEHVRRGSQIVELEKELVKAINLPKALVNFGRLWRISPCDLDPVEKAGLYERSQQVEEMEYFLSHTWQTKGWKKVLTLTFRFGLISGWVCFSIMAVFVAILCLSNVLPALGIYPMVGMHEASLPYGPWFFVTLLPTWWLGLALWPSLKCLWGKQKDCFLDVVCIDQCDKDRMLKGIYGLGYFLKKSKNLVILWSPPQFSRKWCVYEIAAYFGINKTGKVLMYPLFMEQVVILVQIIQFSGALMTCMALLTKDEEAKQVIILMRGLQSWLCMIIFGHCARKVMREKDQLRQALANFDIHKAECREQKDADYIHGAVKEWYGSEDAFNQYVRGEFREDILSRLKFGARGWPWVYIVAMCLPSMGGALDVLMAMIRDGTSPAELYISWFLVYSTMYTLGGPCVFQLCIGMTEYFAHTGSSNQCLDWSFSVILMTVETIVPIMIFALPSTLWQESLGFSALYALIITLAGLVLYRRDICKKEEPSTKVKKDASVLKVVKASDEEAPTSVPAKAIGA